MPTVFEDSPEDKVHLSSLCIAGKASACFQLSCAKTHLPHICSDPTGNGKVKRKKAEDAAYLSQNCSGRQHSIVVQTYQKICDESTVAGSTSGFAAEGRN